MILRWLPDAPLISAELESTAEKWWASRPEGTFNGSLMMLTDLASQPDIITLTGIFTEYRYFFAQKESGVDFGVRFVAVSGMILCDDHLIFARRSPQVSTYPRWLELVPSGGIDRTAARDDGSIDFTGKLREEFSEETTLPAEVVSEISAFGVVYDDNIKTYDIACQIRVNLPPADILSAMKNSDEYIEPTAIALADAPQWIQQHQAKMMPASLAVLKAWQSVNL